MRASAVLLSRAGARQQRHRGVGTTRAAWFRS